MLPKLRRDGTPWRLIGLFPGSLFLSLLIFIFRQSHLAQPGLHTSYVAEDGLKLMIILPLKEV